MLADQVDIVVGVDTHKYALTGAVVMAKTAAALEDRSVPVGPDGYQEFWSLQSGTAFSGPGPSRARQLWSG